MTQLTSWDHPLLIESIFYRESFPFTLLPHPYHSQCTPQDPIFLVLWELEGSFGTAQHLGLLKLWRGSRRQVLIRGEDWNILIPNHKSAPPITIKVSGNIVCGGLWDKTTINISSLPIILNYHFKNLALGAYLHFVCITFIRVSFPWVFNWFFWPVLMMFPVQWQYAG